MNRISLLMIGIPLMIVGCTKTTPAVEVAPDSPDLELSFSALTKGNAVSNALTKGFVKESGDYNVFVDVQDPSDATETGVPRTIRLSAWNSTKEADYFLDKKFSKGSDDMWHANPKIYYPLGCYVDLLGYSAGDTIVAEWQSAHVVKLQVEKTQDDILYSSAKTSSMEHNLNMTFHHSQAWIQFLLEANIANAVRVDSIYWENVYDKGELRLEFDAEHSNEPKADWNFFTQDLKNVGVDDPYDRLDVKLPVVDPISAPGVKPVQLNMLLPEQAHTSFVILYTLENGTGSNKQFAYRVKASSLASTEWERSHKYTYTVKFDMKPITLDPTVARPYIWVEEHIDRMNSIDLIEGVFTVDDSGTPTVKSDDKKVLFSKGNLQYRGSDSTWRFAEHQYDWVGHTTNMGGMPVQNGSVKNSDNVPTKVSLPSPTPLNDDERKLYNGWIDLFGWGTSIIKGSANHCNPWETESGTYGPDESVLNKDTDWGKNIRVYEYVLPPESSFRTLTSAEWEYLLKDDRCKNPDPKYDEFEHSYMFGTLRFGVGSGEKVTGIFLFPDDFVWKVQFGPMPGSFPGGFTDYTVDNTVGGRWDAMEFAGVVFIPCAGQRSGTTYTPELLNVWTADVGKCYTGGAVPVAIDTEIGCSVRLVTNWPAAGTTP